MDSNADGGANEVAQQQKQVPVEIEEILTGSRPKRQSNKKMYLKVKYEGETRRFGVRTTINYTELLQVIRFLFDIDDHVQLAMHYEDAAASCIVFDTDLELTEVARQALDAYDLDPVKLFVERVSD